MKIMPSKTDVGLTKEFLPSILSIDKINAS